MSKTYSEKGNKPSTAKVSVAGIHRWGMTSYTSLRKARMNGERQKEVAAEEPTKRAKLDNQDPFSFEPSEPSPAAVAAPAKPRKFFKSGSRAAPKNSDFDALRLSVPPTFSGSKQELFVNIPTKPPVFLGGAPNIVDLRYAPAGFETLISLDLSAKQDVLLEPSPFVGAPSSQESSSFVASSQESQGGFAPSQESDKDVFFGAQESFPSRDSPPKDVLFAASSHKEDPFPPRELLPKDIPFGTSSRELLKDVPFGTPPPPRELRKDVLFATPPPRELPKDIPVRRTYGAPRQGDVTYSRHRDTPPPRELSGAHQDTVSVQDDKDVLFGSQELYGTGPRDDFFAASSQEDPTLPESSKDEFLTPTDTDSGQLTQDSLLDSQPLDFASSQSSEKSVDSSGASKRHRKIFSSSSKFKAVYNHRHWHSSKKPEEVQEEKGNLADEFEEEMAKENLRENSITPYKCTKEQPQQFYTVVANVKQAYQCHESGETQEFNDDIEYLLECVQECNAIGTRCLSVLNLAAKCMSPAFRIHLRAHGTMPKIFSALQDAPTDQNLSLCTSALMFVLSQDRLTMDIEASTLSLMLRLLEAEDQETEEEEELILRDPGLAAMQDRHRERVGALCEEMKLKGHAKHLKMDNINTGILAMETLLSLTSRKAGEWFKEEMRTLRGLDRIADTVTSSTESLLPDEQEVIRRPSEAQLDKIRKIDRCLRVLENVTHLNPENQEYLLTYKDSLLISSCLQLLRLFKSHLLAQPQGEAGGDVVSCLLNLLKILSNITYGIALDDSMFPSGDGLMDQLLMLILQVPRAVSTEKRFDLLVLSLGLMINLVEYCSSNSAKFVQMHGLGTFEGVNDGYEMLATEALVELMCERLECARLSEEQADELLSTQEAKHNEAKHNAPNPVNAEAAADELEETLMKTLQKAGKHMEHSIVAAYIVILLGCVSQKHPDFVQVMKDFVPNGNFDIMVDVLKKFKSFVSLTGSVGNRELGSIQKVIHLLESS